jgi:hypothetical protein
MDGIGKINLSQTVEILFYIDEYGDRRFANIRKFIKSQTYAGPTRSGIKLSKQQLELICKTLGEISPASDNLHEKDLVTVPVSERKFISVCLNCFKGQFGLDIRQYLKTENYTGPTKKGIRIPLDYLEEATRFCQKMLREFEDHTGNEPPTTEKEHPRGESVCGKNRKTEGVPDEYLKYFE